MADFDKFAKRDKDEPAGIPNAACFGCGAILPWPSHKQEKASHRIIGRTRGNQTVCNWCYERSPEFDWRGKAFTDFAERHRDDEWGMLLKSAYAMKGAPMEDKQEFMGYLKEISRKCGMTKALPYDPQQREPA